MTNLVILYYFCYMAKEKPKSKRPKQYDEKLIVKGTFSDIIAAAVKHRANNIYKNKKV